MRAPASALAFALAASLASAQTRPLRTEQASTAPAGRLALELGAESMRAEPNPLSGGDRERWDVPLLRLVWSPAANVELDLEWVGRVIAKEDPDFGDVSDWGDVTLRAKARFVEEQGPRPALGARFGVTLPETTFGNGLGPDTLRMRAELLLTQPLGRLRLDANAGLAIEDDPVFPHRQDDLLAYGVALRLPAGSLELLAEVNGLLDATEKPSAAEARAGIRFGSGRVKGDLAVRIGLGQRDGDWGASAGLSWTLRD